MKGKKIAAAIALVLWLVTACGSSSEDQEKAQAARELKQSGVDGTDKTEGMRAKVAFHCDPATKKRTSVTLVAVNESNPGSITVRFTRRSNPEAQRETLKEVSLAPGGSDSVDQPVVADSSASVSIFKVKDGDVKLIAFVRLSPNDACLEGDLSP